MSSEELIKRLAEECLKEKKPCFIYVGADKAKIKTVTPEEVSLPTDKKFNSLVRAVSGFDREDYM